ncbi:hypothetical protein D3C87_1331770 [compost metagenome]
MPLGQITLIDPGADRRDIAQKPCILVADGMTDETSQNAETLDFRTVISGRREGKRIDWRIVARDEADDVDRRILSGKIFEHCALAMREENSLFSENNGVTRNLGGDGQAANHGPAQFRARRRRSRTDRRNDISCRGPVAIADGNGCFDGEVSTSVPMPQFLKRQHGGLGGFAPASRASANALPVVRPERHDGLPSWAWKRQKSSMEPARFIWEDALEKLTVMSNCPADADPQGAKENMIWRRPGIKRKAVRKGHGTAQKNVVVSRQFPANGGHCLSLYMRRNSGLTRFYAVSKQRDFHSTAGQIVLSIASRAPPGERRSCRPSATAPPSGFTDRR